MGSYKYPHTLKIKLKGKWRVLTFIIDEKTPGYYRFVLINHILVVWQEDGLEKLNIPLTSVLWWRVIDKVHVKNGN